eukprot:TRINITY_DN1611_c0_g3_i3.p1 TRINITY_DN1611_c0_g3~~TRINITY_DN1611_c0_g3_i3.p1  ORF type:complete len:410 (+),score=91.63 TRINITY_DN1611_c0_g3_i3:41-1231(+)
MNELLKGLDSTEAVKISAFTLLAENSNVKEFLKLLDGRLKQADSERKLPYWCLIDSLLKYGSAELREGLMKVVPRHLETQLPWEIEGHRARYLSIIESWKLQGVFTHEELSKLEKSAKSGLIGCKERARETSGGGKMGQGFLRNRLRHAAQAAVEIQVGQEEQLLVPADSGPEQGVDLENEPTEEQPEAEQVEESPEPGMQETTTTGGREDGSSGSPVPDSLHAERPRVCPDNRVDVRSCVEEIQQVVGGMYRLPVQCSRTARRHEKEISKQVLDNIFKVRSADVKLHKSRTWYHTASAWSRITDTHQGLLAVAVRSELHTAPTSDHTTRKRKVSSKQEVHLKDPTAAYRCAVCGDLFSKIQTASGWKLDDCIEVYTRAGSSYVHPICEDDIQSKV